MSLLGRKWQIFEKNERLSQRIAGEFGISSLTAQVLMNRGLVDSDPIKKFLDPKLSYLSDPMSLPGAEAAAKRVLLAKERGEKVLVFGDYDVDGVTGTVILLQTLNMLGISSSYYIPHRYKEGYGMSEAAVRKAKKDGIDLIITVDCGTSNIKEISLAASLGIDVVVTDHHNVPEKLPSAVSIMNPKLNGSDDPSRELSGAGVAFKFCWALLRLAGISESSALIEMLDLVCLGTIADVVPLLGENRILAVQGLAMINQKKRTGLRMLSETAGLFGRIGSNHINFALSPRINAAGRLEHAGISVDLLLEEDEDRARDMAVRLGKINSLRQDIGARIAEQAFSQIDENSDDKLLLVSGEGWHPGVIGIVASRIVDRHSRPAILVGVADGEGRGSARSVDGFNVFGLLESVKDIFIDFGGHKAAAGFKISPKNISELKTRLKKKMETLVSAEDLVPKIKIDAEVFPSDISMGLIKELESLAPHGPGNPMPVFLTRGLSLLDKRHVGGSGDHIKLKFSSPGAMIEAIGFKLGEIGGRLVCGRKYDILHNMGSNTWNGAESAEIKLVDIRETV